VRVSAEARVRPRACHTLAAPLPPSPLARLDPIQPRSTSRHPPPTWHRIIPPADLHLPSVPSVPLSKPRDKQQSQCCPY
jgi:hypothetical protein